MATRYAGKNAALYLWTGSVWALSNDLYDWRIEFTTDVHIVAVKGDFSKRKYPSPLIDGELTAKHWYSGGLSAASHILDNAGSRTFARQDFILMAVDGGIDNFGTNALSKVQGTGYFRSTHLGAPRGGYEDDIALTLDTVPTIT